MSFFLQLVVDGLVQGMLLACVAAGFGVVYRSLRVFHVAVGAQFVFSGYAFYAATALLRLSPVWAIALTLLLSLAFAQVLEFAVYRPFARKGCAGGVTMIASLGGLILTENVIALCFGNEMRTIPHPPVPVVEFGCVHLTVLQIAQFLCSLAAFAAAGAFVRCSRLMKAAWAQGEMYDEAVEAMETNLAPLRARIEGEKQRPVVSLALSVSQDNALDRRNFTLCVVSNEIQQAGTNWHVRGWVFSNNVLKSEPIMQADVNTAMGETAASFECVWREYGTNAVEVVIDGETYETYEMSVDVPTNLVRNINMLVERWVSIGSRDKEFNFGNRQLRINGELCCTTNDASFLGRFSTTNGVDLSELFTPYIDRGLFRFAEKQEEESK